MRLAIIALLTAQLNAPAASAAVEARCALRIFDARAGTALARAALPVDQRFALLYRHSVTLGTVESQYHVRQGEIMQTAELFDAHGPGMASAAGPGERFEQRHDGTGVRFVLHMARPLPALVVRLHEIPAFRLQVGDQVIALDQWQAKVVAVKPDCAAGAQVAADRPASAMR